MKRNNRKQAYTLAEIMVVMLVLTIIFAAFSPLFTKRRLSSTSSKYAVWEYADRTSLDGFSDPGEPTFTGEFFFGITPTGKETVNSILLPLSKLVIRSGEVTTDKKVQRQIQFRYGRTSTDDHGVFAGSWFMDGKNALLGGRYNSYSNDTTTGARGNVAIGYEALSNLVSAQANTAIGYYALANSTSSKNNVAVGYRAGETPNYMEGNTYIGSYAGNKASSRKNTFIGYKAGGNGASNNENDTFNTYIGANAGLTSSTADKNVAIGYNALSSITTGSYNIAVGNSALGHLTTGSYNVAIGYNACSEVVNGSYKTCIGVNSGPHAGSSAENYLNARNDNSVRTYIGSKPTNYGGDAVLEIHNIPDVNNTMAATQNDAPSVATNAEVTTSTTTVINGNLIVRGRPYFTVGKTLYHFHDRNYINGKQPGPDKIRAYGFGSGSYSDTAYGGTCVANQKSYSFANKCIQLTSDRRLKNIGSKSVAGLAEIKKLKVYNYTFKNDKDKLPHVGVIAQDLQKVFPNSVFEGSDGYLRIKWDEMFYATINAIKELDKKIVALVNRAVKVETQITKLEKENIVLKTQVDSLTARVNKLKAQ